MFTKDIKIRFYDCDPAGILFFSNVFSYAHSVYEEFLESLPLDRNYFYDSDYSLPLVHSEADFHNPIIAGEEITINLVVKDIKNTSFDLHFEFVKDGSLRCAVVNTVHVCILKEMYKKTQIPDDLRKNLEKHLIK